MDTKDILIATARAQGLKQTEIEAATGIPQSTISRRLQKSELKELIEQIQTDIIQETAEPTKNTIVNLIKNYESNTCKDKNAEIEKQHAFKCIQKMAEVMGVFPTYTPSIILQQFNNTLVAEVSETKALREFLDWKRQRGTGIIDISADKNQPE